MRRIRLLKVGDPTIDQQREAERWAANLVDYGQVIREVVRLPLNRQQGVTIDEMRQGIRILDALDAVNGSSVLDLEDAQWEHLCEKIKAFPWGTVDRRLLQFCDTVLNATAEAPD